jgi:hypothetical protein
MWVLEVGDDDTDFFGIGHPFMTLRHVMILIHDFFPCLDGSDSVIIHRCLSNPLF